MEVEEWLQKLVSGCAGRRKGDGLWWTYEYIEAVGRIRATYDGEYIDEQELDWYRDAYKDRLGLIIDTVIHIGGE